MLLIATLMVFSLPAGCAREDASPVRIGTNVWIGSEPLYLARALGHLDSRQIRLVEYPSASEVLRAYRNQAIDGMIISLDELIGLGVDGLQPRVILVADISHGADAIVARPGMNLMRDLKGRRVAVESGALGAYVLTRALALNDMTPGDLTVVHLESNEQPRAFEAGEVDAAVTFDPYRSQMIERGGTTIFDSTRIPGEIVDLLAVRASVLEGRTAALRELVIGWFKALTYLREHPEDAARRMGVRQQIGAEAFLAALKGLRLPSLAENLAMIDGRDATLASTGRKMMAMMLEARLIDEPIALEEVFEPRLLKSLPP